MPDYKQFRILLNMKTLLLFEQMSGKSFYNLSAEDYILLIYCALVSNNDIKPTYSQFRSIMGNHKIARALTNKCQEELDFISQFNQQQKEAKEEKAGTGNITDIINTLILSYGLDINYVMNELRLWHLPAIVKGMEEKTKADMVEKRFWTYMQILPHIDGKKIKSPEKLLPFPWEKEQQKQDSIRFMEDNRDAIKAFFNRNRKEDGTVQVQPE